MRIAIVSPGGVGGYYGGMLARAGHQVTALARGAHLAAIQANGLRVQGPRGDVTVPITASANASDLGPADVVLFAVKLYQIDEAARAAIPLFGPDTLGISLLNGIGGAEAANAILPNAPVVGGCAYVSAVIAAPGHIRYTGEMSSMVYGTPDATAARAHGESFAAICQEAGIDARMAEDGRYVLWEKLIGLSANSALTTAARLPAGHLYHDPDVAAVALALMKETAAVARAQGVALPEGTEEYWLGRLKGFPPGMYASMYHDIARGGPLEVDGLSGHIVREGRRLGVPTPHHAALYAVLKPHRAGTPPAL
jgi:2-dehydropantoate 2-reductase